MLVTCFADDPREPVYIGETTVDLNEALTKGETDEWFTLTNKEKYCGEVYLELTFWSNEKPPEKKAKRPSTSNPQYGGPGSFTPSSDGTPQPINGSSPSRTDGSSITPLKASGSIASVNLYQPPYERQSRHSDVDQLANRVADLVVDSNSRRESLPPPGNAGLSEFGYSESPSRINGTYTSTLSSSGSISSVHSIHTLPPSLSPHHRNTLSARPESSHSSNGATTPLRIPSASYHSPHSPHRYDSIPVADNYSASSSGFLYNTAFPEPEIPTPSPVSYPSYDPPYDPTPTPVASSGFVLPQSTPASSDYGSPPSFPYQPQPSHLSYQPPPVAPPAPQTPQPLQPPQTPFPSLQTPPPPLNSYPVTPSSHSSEDYGARGNSPGGAANHRDSQNHTTPSPQPPPVNAFQQLQGVAPQGSRPLPFPQVKSDQPTSSGFSTVSQPGLPFSPPGPPPPLVPPPPPPPPPRHRPSLPPTPSLTPSASYPPSALPSYPNSTFNTPPAPPPSQFYNHTSPSPSHHSQSSFSSPYYNTPETLPNAALPRQPYPYATPPPPSRTPTLPYQSPPQWQTPPYPSGYVNTPPHPPQGYSSPPPPQPSVMPTPNFYANTPTAPPYGYPPSNPYGW